MAVSFPAIGLCAFALAAMVEISVAIPSRRELFWKFNLAGQNLAPLENGLLKFTPMSAASAPVAMAPSEKFPLALAAKRTRRPDVLERFELYNGGWDMGNKHYWTSAAFTGFGGFLVAILWFVTFGLVLSAHYCCKWRIVPKDKGSCRKQYLCLIFLLFFTTTASIGCILLSLGQDELHDEVLNTLDFVVNQSDFTVEILRNVTDFLIFAKTIDIEEAHIPSDVQIRIDKLSVDLNSAADMLSEKTSENSLMIRRLITDVRSILIAVAAVMLSLAVLGFVFSMLGQKLAMHIFIMSGWLLVVVTFLLCGVFVIVNNVRGDTCTSMDEWVRYPQAETALSNILPCIDEETTNQTLHQSKDVICQLVNIVNLAIFTVVNSYGPQSSNSFYYNQSGPTMPTLCSPYDSHLQSQECQPDQVSFENASMVWSEYICEVTESGICINVGRITPFIYKALITAVNVSYALDHYAPLLLSLGDCNFVRDTFRAITTSHCPNLEHSLFIVNVGLALSSIGVMLCLVLWIVHANRPQREEVFVVPLAEVKVSDDANN